MVRHGFSIRRTMGGHHYGNLVHATWVTFFWGDVGHCVEVYAIIVCFIGYWGDGFSQIERCFRQLQCQQRFISHGSVTLLPSPLDLRPMGPVCPGRGHRHGRRVTCYYCLWLCLPFFQSFSQFKLLWPWFICCLGEGVHGTGGGDPSRR